MDKVEPSKISFTAHLSYCIFDAIEWKNTKIMLMQRFIPTHVYMNESLALHTEMLQDFNELSSN